jgi:hypothetical protein
MAVARFSDTSDVYVYYSTAGGIDCCGCRLSERRTLNLANEVAMIAHLEAHVIAGHQVPRVALGKIESAREG